MASPQGQFTPRSARKNLYSVVEVQSDEEVRCFKVEGGISYIFLNENSDKLYIRQINDSGELVTYTYRFSQDEGDSLLDPVTKLERRMENIEKMLGGIVNVQSKNSTGNDVKDGELSGGEKDVGVESVGSPEISGGDGFGRRKDGGSAEGYGNEHGKGKKY